MDIQKTRAVVVLSGGLDSTTVLYNAIARGYDVEALSFSYGQSHSVELSRARKITGDLGIPHKVIQLPLDLFGDSSLVGIGEIPKGRDIIPNNIPNTFVPGRNLVFLSLAVSYAAARGIEFVFTGVNAQDYSGYPDCRPEFISQLNQTVEFALGANDDSSKRITILTPLLFLSKKEIVEMGQKLNVPFEFTWSCYSPEIDSDSGEARPCGRCDSCVLRARGFDSAGIVDPTV